jgi:hypothetical protein
MVDLEWGGNDYIMKRYRWLFDFVKAHRRRIRRGAVAMAVLTVALVVKLGFTHMAAAAEGATAITMDEETYEPFRLGELRLSLGDGAPPVRQMVLRESPMNRRMQAHNVAEVAEEIRRWLDRTENTCVHLRHWGVPLDVVVFDNVTVVNPQILEEGPVRKNILEVDLAGEERWRQRATSVAIKFYDETLSQKWETLWGDQAFCLAHYIL